MRLTALRSKEFLRKIARPAIACAVTAALLGGCAWRHGTPERPVVTKVDFTGNETVSARDLRGAIESQAAGRLPFSQPEYLDPDTAARDVLRLERYLRARGFYEAQVDGWRFAWTGLGRGRLRFFVREGVPVFVQRIRIEGLEALPEEDRQAITRKLPLREGRLIEEAAYDLTKQEVLRRMRARGFAQAEVAGEVRIDPRTHLADVRIATEPGDRFSVGPIRVEGNRSAARSSILWASALQTGQIYSTAKIDDAQGRVYDLGAFRTVSIDTGNPDPANRLPVTIRVSERRLQTLETGVGFAIDRTRQQVQARETYRNRNLFGGLDQFETTVRGGWSVLPDALHPVRDGPIWGADAHFHHPNLLWRGVLFSTDATYDRTIEESWKADSGRGTVGLQKGFHEFDLGAAYGLLVYRLTDITIATAAQQIDPKATPDRCPTPCLISFVNPHVAWDHRDDPIEPRNGAFVDVELERGGGILGGTHDYWRAEPELRLYQTPLFWSRRLTLAGRSRIGWVWPIGGPSPIVRRFFSGGPDGMRGYSARRLSPMVHTADGRLVPIGGDDLFEASGEARYFLRSKLIAAAFLDAGAVEFTGKSVFDPARIALAAGPGLRYLTPIGPVRVDVAYRFRTPISTTLDPPFERVHEALWTFHVGLGEAF